MRPSLHDLAAGGYKVVVHKASSCAPWQSVHYEPEGIVPDPATPAGAAGEAYATARSSSELGVLVVDEGGTTRGLLKSKRDKDIDQLRGRALVLESDIYVRYAGGGYRAIYCGILK